MKKLLALVLTMLFVIASSAHAAPCPIPEALTDVDISFSSFEWYSDYPTVIELADEMNWGKYSDWFSRGGCTTPHWTIFKEAANCFAGSESNCGGSLLFYKVPKVAGYEDVTAHLYFIFRPGLGNYENYNAPGAMCLYLGEYEFSPADLDACYDDLVQKLANIYGDTAYVGEDKSLSYNYTYWVNNDDAVVGICKKSTGVVISYSAPHSEENLEQIEQWIAKTEIENAAGDSSGL